MDKNGVITIDNFQKGMAVSPYFGFGKFINADISSEKGVVKGSSPLATSGTLPAITDNITARYSTFTGTADGKFYNGTTLITTVSGSIHDILIYKDYVIITTSTSKIHSYGPLSVSPSFHSNILDLGASSVYGYRKMVKMSAIDQIVIANNGYMAIISSSFTGTSDSGFNATYLTLPDSFTARSACEYATEIAIPCANETGLENARIYFWDGVDTKVQDPVIIPEKSINQIISSNNRLFFVGNDTGTFYEGNKVTYSERWKIQDKREAQTFANYQNAITLHQGRIIWGYAPQQTSYPDPVYYAVYSYAFDYGATILNNVSTGNVGTNAQLSITCLYSSGNQGVYICGFNDGGTAYVNTINAFSYDDAKIQSQLYIVGLNNNKKTFSHVDIFLGRNLQTGESITLRYRTSLSDDFTDVATYSSDWVGENHIAADCSISDLVMVQFEVEIDAGTNSLTTPSLLSIVLK